MDGHSVAWRQKKKKKKKGSFYDKLEKELSDFGVDVIEKMIGGRRKRDGM